MKRRRPLVIALLILAVIIAVLLSHFQTQRLVLTGIVTTDEVIVSSQIQGRIARLLVNQGDSVKRGDLLAVIESQEWQADLNYFASTEQSLAAQVQQAEAEVTFQEALTENQIKQAEATLASVEAQTEEGQADFENARLNFQRETDLHAQGASSTQSFDQARAANDSAKAHVASLQKQIAAAEAAVNLAKANLSQVAMRRAGLLGMRQQFAAASAQQEKAKVHLGYTDLHAPIDGVVNLRAALAGEVVNPGQAVVTLIDPDQLWVRADIEESFIDRVHLGDKMMVRLPSGSEREGTVFFRGVDAEYATQRDVSRTKRDIKTFELRLRCDNHDRALAVGMTAYVVLPLAK